jgi:hypothetical protein
MVFQPLATESASFMEEKRELPAQRQITELLKTGKSIDQYSPDYHAIDCAVYALEICLMRSIVNRQVVGGYNFGVCG